MTTCDACGSDNAVLAPHTRRVLCDPCFAKALLGEELLPVRRLTLPPNHNGDPS